MAAVQIEWLEPWRPLTYEVEVPRIQQQLEREITEVHPLYNRAPKVLGRRFDNDDVLVVLSDETFARVHLVWGKGPGSFPTECPSWSIHNSLASFLEQMQQDSADYAP